MKKISLIIVFVFNLLKAFAQTDTLDLDDSAYMIGKAVVTGFQSADPRNSSLNLERYELQKLAEKAPFNLSDALAKLPGISQITTGNSISKPVIRGLYGNRVLVLLSGLRFDNQQWQDEHGLGLSQIGIDRVEVIKGPASLLYGSDAIGGVVNIIEERPKEKGRKMDAGTQLFSNTLGTLTDIGWSNSTDKNWRRLRIGFENHADYSDGKNIRVLNSRNRGYYLKAGSGFQKKRWSQENSYNFSYNQYGFILDDLASSFSGDARWVRSMNGPHHNVILNLLNTQNTLRLKQSVLKLNGGFQSNIRMEDEGGGQISLNMHLTSLLENAKWERVLNKYLNAVVNQQFSYTHNTNYGGRIIIPDAATEENNLTGYLKFLKGKWTLEGGLGFNQKRIRTFLTRTLNSPSQPNLGFAKPVLPFVKNNLTTNGMIGMVFRPQKWMTVKQNNATGFRAPNLAELSSNGLHEGVYRYEIGDPDLKVEQNFNTDLSVEIERRQVFLMMSAYHNYFSNYIYLTPSDHHDSFYHFPVYLYKQQNARIVGGEAMLILKPASLKGIQFKETVSLTRGTLAKGGNLPFIPAYKAVTAIRWEHASAGRKHIWFAEPEMVYVMQQDRPAMFETYTPSYVLFNFSAGMNIQQAEGKRNLILSLNATNITNTFYYDHLSRLKNYGIYNMGRNIVVSIRKQF